jgi:hypothetical protein
MRPPFQVYALLFPTNSCSSSDMLAEFITVVIVQVSGRFLRHSLPVSSYIFSTSFKRSLVLE